MSSKWWNDRFESISSSLGGEGRMIWGGLVMGVLYGRGTVLAVVQLSEKGSADEGNFAGITMTVRKGVINGGEGVI